VTPDSPAEPRLPGAPGLAAPVLDAVAAALSRLRFGVVQLTIHDGKVVQLDVTDRRRFPPDP
jgi:hypothetical protein